MLAGKLHYRFNETYLICRMFGLDEADDIVFDWKSFRARNVIAI